MNLDIIESRAHEWKPVEEAQPLSHVGGQAQTSITSVGGSR